MPQLVVILGPHAVGKMTVGQELAAITGFKLLHNHMTIDLVSNFFPPFQSPEGRRLMELFRREILEAVAKSDLPGLILTSMMDFDDANKYRHINGIMELFAAHGGQPACVVELFADKDVRLARNRTENRLTHKPTKRDIKQSEETFLSIEATHRLNSLPEENPFPNYFRLDNTDIPPEQAARIIQAHFGL